MRTRAPAEWPAADFTVGNPPFIGTARMREYLGDGYAETPRVTYPEVPESVDFVLYWWHKAATLVRAGKAQCFGLTSTNSLRQTFAGRVVQLHLNPGARAVPARSAAPETEAPENFHASNLAKPLRPGAGRAPSEPFSLVIAIPDQPASTSKRHRTPKRPEGRAPKQDWPKALAERVQAVGENRRFP